MRARCSLLGVAVAALALGLAGCSGSTSGSPGDVVLTEWLIQVEEPTDRTLQVRNEGSEPHQLVVSREGGKVLAMTNLLDPGQSAEVILPEVGRLQLTSRFVSQEGTGALVDDTTNGMHLDVDWRR